IAFDEVDDTPHKESELGIALHQLPCCVRNRSSDIGLPVSLIARSSQAGFGARRATLGFLCEYSLGLVVIDHRHGIAALALCGAIDASRQICFMLRSVGGLCHFRLARKVA